MALSLFHLITGKHHLYRHSILTKDKRVLKIKQAGIEIIALPNLVLVVR